MTRGRPRRQAARRQAARGGGRLPARRAGPTTTALCTVVVLGALSGCAGSDGAALARQACQHVDRSLALYRASLRQSDPRAAQAQQAQALMQLRDALPTAATAAGEAGQYQALMATLAESDHLPESLLVHALGAQCAAAQSDNQIVPDVPGTTETPATRPPPTGY